MKHPDKQRARLNMFRRYRAKNDQALANYDRLANNWRRSEYWLNIAGKWAARARREFPAFCPDTLK